MGCTLAEIARIQIYEIVKCLCTAKNHENLLNWVCNRNMAFEMPKLPLLFNVDHRRAVSSQFLKILSLLSHVLQNVTNLNMVTGQQQLETPFAGNATFLASFSKNSPNLYFKSLCIYWHYMQGLRTQVTGNTGRKPWIYEAMKQKSLLERWKTLFLQLFAALQVEMFRILVGKNNSSDSVHEKSIMNISHTNQVIHTYR